MSRYTIGDESPSICALPHARLLSLLGIATQTRLDRDALLAGLPPGFVPTMPVATTFVAQILRDLDTLNLAAPLNGTPPMRIWLLNAIALLGPRSEADYMLQTLQLLDGAADSTANA